MSPSGSSVIDGILKSWTAPDYCVAYAVGRMYFDKEGTIRPGLMRGEIPWA